MKRQFVTQQYHYPRSSPCGHAIVHKNGHSTPVGFWKLLMALSRFIVLLLGSQFRKLQLLYVPQYFPELILIGTAPAEPEASVSGWPDYSCGNLGQFQTEGLNLLFPKMLRKHQSFEPIEQVIRQHADHQAACVHHHGMTAHTGKIKTVLGLLDVVLHTAAVAVKPDDILRWKVHVCYDECAHVSHLVCGLFHFTDDTPGIFPWACLYMISP